MFCLLLQKAKLSQEDLTPTEDYSSSGKDLKKETSKVKVCAHVHARMHIYVCVHTDFVSACTMCVCTETKGRCLCVYRLRREKLID